MEIRFRETLVQRAAYICMAVIMLLGVFFTLMPVAGAEQAPKKGTNQRLITLHDGNDEKSFITSDKTLREAFDEQHIQVGEADRVEPGLDEQLVSNNYQVNIYRARPVVITDGSTQMRVMSAYQTPEQIADHANIAMRDEDTASMGISTNYVADGSALMMTIDRAKAVHLNQYGKKNTFYTQKDTVDEFLESKDITLKKGDTLSVKRSSAITDGMDIELYRNGTQTKTEDKTIEHGTREIQDADRPVGYRKVKTKGVDGKKTITYKVTLKNGKEIKRKKIRTVVVTEPKDEVVIVGSKPKFGGDFAKALAKLRSCEGGYDSINPAGPYYGAYQFDEGTWNSVSSAPYGDATPAEQDAAARKLYERRGWSPWPVCAAGLPDTYR